MKGGTNKQANKNHQAVYQVVYTLIFAVKLVVLIWKSMGTYLCLERTSRVLHFSTSKVASWFPPGHYLIPKCILQKAYACYSQSIESQ